MTFKPELDLKVAAPALGKTPRIKEETKYASPAERIKDEQKHYSLADKFATNKDKPTTAAGKKGSLDLPSVLSAVDPKGLSSVAPMMYQMLGQIQASSSGSSQSSRKKTIEDAFSGALAILSNKYTFEKLTIVFDNALKDNQIKLINSEYRDIVKNALANLYKNYITYGEGNLTVSSYDTVTEIGTAPDPIVNTVPDYYVQQYYLKSEDPYPGYKTWVSPDGKTTVYTVRNLGDYYYSSAVEEIYSVAEQELATNLDPYIENGNLTAKILNDFLTEQDSNVETNTQNASGGNNSADNAINTLMKLAGYAGAISNLQQQVQLPVSVLAQGAIKKSTEAFMKNIGQLKQEKEKAKQAAQPLSAVSSLLNTVSSVSGAAATITSMTASAKSLYNTIKS